MSAQDSRNGQGGTRRAMKLEGLVDMTRCLLIDGESSERRRLQALLAALGVETDFTSGADDALKYCNDNAPEMVLVSAEAPAAADRDFVRRLMRNPRGKPPVVFLYAGTPDTDLIGRSIIDGAADVLMMPLDRDLLQFKLRQAGVIA